MHNRHYIFDWFSSRSRKKRAAFFRNNFSLDSKTKILDLGSNDGTNINSVLQGSAVDPKNVFIADIRELGIKRGALKFGYNPVVIKESEPLPFPDHYFDILYCSSVIEHVTVNKDCMWDIRSDSIFASLSCRNQKHFSDEIRRLSKQYFVQTPYKYFPIESHTWLPFASILSRRLLIRLLRLTNKFWLKGTCPDWFLLDKPSMSRLFYDATIHEEKFLGVTKSLMAIKTYK